VAENFLKPSCGGPAAEDDVAPDFPPLSLRFSPIAVVETWVAHVFATIIKAKRKETLHEDSPGWSMAPGASSTPLDARPLLVLVSGVSSVFRGKVVAGNDSGNGQMNQLGVHSLFSDQALNHFFCFAQPPLPFSRKCPRAGWNSRNSGL
jgi:hypothetical protein